MQLGNIFNVGTGVGAVIGVACGAGLVAFIAYVQEFISFGGISDVADAPTRESVQKLATYIVPTTTLIGAVVGAIVGS